MFELDALLAEPPGSDVVAALASLDRAALSPDDGVTVAIIADRAMSWLCSLQDEAILAAGSGHTQVQELLVLDPRPGRFGETRLRIEDVIREEIAAATRWSLNHAHDRLVRARLLAAGLPRTRQAQAAGRISPAHVQALVQQARRLPFAAEVLAGDATGAQRAAFTHACEQFETRVLPAAERGTVAQARTAARRAVLAIDGEGEARRRQRAKAMRDAFVLAEDDGLSLFAVRMATEQAHACLAAVDALAHDDRFPSDCDATIGERRAQAATALILRTPGGEVPQPRLRAHLDITIDLATLLDLRATCGETEGHVEGSVAVGSRRSDDGAVEITGAGAVGVDVLRELLGDPDVAVTMRRLITDPATGHLLDYGRRTYQVPGPAAGVPHRPRPGLPLPRLRPQGEPLPTRSRHRLARRRRNQSWQSRGPVRAAPPAEDAHRLDHHQRPPRRLLHLDLTARPRVRPRAETDRTPSTTQDRGHPADPRPARHHPPPTHGSRRDPALLARRPRRGRRYARSRSRRSFATCPVAFTL